MRKLRQLHKQQEEEQIRSARQRFVFDSEDDANGGAGSALTLSSTLRTRTSPGRKKRQQSFRAAALATQEKTMPEGIEASFKSTQSMNSLSSVSSNEAAAAAAMALEQGLISSQTFSTSAFMTDDVLGAIAQRAKKQLKVVSERRETVGRWKKGARSKPNCQVFESLSKTKDQFSVMVAMDVPCSLQELASVYSTKKDTEFHRSMEAVFGDQYVYGVNVRSVDCAFHAEDVCAALCSQRPREECGAFACSSHLIGNGSSGRTPLVRSAKLKINAVSLMQKHRLLWKQRNLTFLDYLEEKSETKLLTRVMQTLDMQEEELEISSVTMSSSTCASYCEEHYSPLQIQNSDDIRQELKGIFAGYVIQEDSDEKVTRVFFYATHSPRSSKLPRSAAQLLRGMVTKVCLLETVVLRRRLGHYPLSRFPGPQDEPAVTSYCATCYTPFKMLRKKYLCRLCSHYTCRKCSNLQEVEKTVGLVEKHRVCVSCVRRVSHCVFSLRAYSPNESASLSGNRWISTRAHLSTDLDRVDPPIMEAFSSQDIEDVESGHTSQPRVLAGFVSEFLHGKDKKQERRKAEVVAQRKQRPQLTLDDVTLWTPESFHGHHNTPKESISLLDSFSTSFSSADSCSRDIAPYQSSSPMGA